MLSAGYTPQEAVSILIRRVHQYERDGLTRGAATKRAAADFGVAVFKVAGLVPSGSGEPGTEKS